MHRTVVRQNGLHIQVADAREPSGPDVNTPADLARVAALLESAQS